MKKYVLRVSILLLILIAFSFCFPIHAKALELELSYEITLSGVCSDGKCYQDGKPEIILSYDNNGKIDGHLLVFADGMNKYDLEGKLIYTKTVDELDDASWFLEVESVDSEYSSSVKGDTDIVLTFYDENDEVRLEKLYGGSGAEYFDYYIPTFDDTGKHDGYMLFISSTSIDLGLKKAGNIIVKFDLDGNILWQHNNIKNDRFVYNDDGGINSYFDEGQHAVLRKSLSGDIINSNDVHNRIDFVSSYNRFNSVDGVVATGVGLYDHTSFYAYIIKYDLDGNEVFYAGRNDYCSYSKIFNSKNEFGINDGYIVVGACNSKTFPVIKYDYSGNEIWRYKSDNVKGISLFDMTENYDENGDFNGYVVIGTLDNDLVMLKYTYPNYKIETDVNTDGGTVLVKKSGFPGEVVEVSVTPKEGYILKRIIVLDESGKEIEVSADGTFVMPEGKVTVSAVYDRIVNPDTISACYVVLGIVLIIAISTVLVNKGKKQEGSVLE